MKLKSIINYVIVCRYIQLYTICNIINIMHFVYSNKRSNRKYLIIYYICENKM